MNVNRLFDLDQRSRESVDGLEKRRLHYDALSRYNGRPFMAIIGPRGAGKTVLLRQLRSATESSIYLSADTLGNDESLSEVVRALRDGYRIRNFFVDEIHFAHRFAAALKEIYDFYDVRLWFTSSSALALHESAWDLSRRVMRFHLGPFSYREYLWFRTGDLIPELPLETALLSQIPDQYLRAGSVFADYLSGGLHPFTLEAPPAPEIFANMLEKVITTDVVAADPTLSIAELDEMRSMLEFIGKSPMDGINYSSVARNLGVSKYRVQKHMDLLERSFILHRAYPHGTNVLKEPKVFMELPYRLIYRPYNEAIGALREDYVSLALRQHGVGFEYAKTNRGAKTPDFVLDLAGETVVVEVGGRGKGRRQFKDLSYERKVVVYHGEGRLPQPSEAVPIHALGFPPVLSLEASTGR